MTENEDSAKRDKTDEIDLEALLSEKEKLESLIKRRFTKTITVMFTDLTGSTRLSAEIGDLPMRSLLKRHNDIVIPAIETNSGVMVKTMGDGTMSYFEDPSDAVVSAITIQREIKSFNRSLQHPPLLIRCGLNTGVGIVEKKDVYGDVVNVAQRFEALANPCEILLSEDTFNVVKENASFVIKFVKETAIKGKAGPQTVYKVEWEPEDSSDIYLTTNEAGDFAGEGMVTSDIVIPDDVEMDDLGTGTQLVETPPAPEYRVKIERKEGMPVYHELLPETMVIGRSPQVEINVPERFVSRRHARIVFEGGEYYIEDLNSHIGTLFNGEKVSKRKMAAGEIFTIGSVKITFQKIQTKIPNEVMGEGSETDGKDDNAFPDSDATLAMASKNILCLFLIERGKPTSSYDLREEPILIGRHEECDIVLKSPLVSRRHSKVWAKNGVAYLEDLSSNNGTFLNGSRVEKGEGKPGDEIKIGPFLLTVQSPLAPKTDNEKWDNDSDGLVKKVFSFLKKPR